MKNVLERDGLFVYCRRPATANMSEAETRGRMQAPIAALNESAKNTAYLLMKRYKDPEVCWTQLKERYEVESNPRKVMLIDRFFSMKKTSSMSMDDYLTDMKEAADSLEELGIPLPEPIVVYYTIKNLPMEYDIQKQMILSKEVLPGYLELESRLLAEEMVRKVDHRDEKEGDALVAYQAGNRRTFNRGGSVNQGGRWTGQTQGRYLGAGSGNYGQNTSSSANNTGRPRYHNSQRYDHDRNYGSSGFSQSRGGDRNQYLRNSERQQNDRFTFQL